MKYANVIIDNKSDNTDTSFTYTCEGDIKAGSKVKVPFAKGAKLREGYVMSISDDDSDIPDKFKDRLKAIAEVDESVSLSPEMLRTAIWMRQRYLCRYIDAIKCFTPAGSRGARSKGVSVLDGAAPSRGIIDSLTQEQETALDTIAKPITRGYHDRFLLHGITGSGKTEIYIRAAGKAIEQDKTVIILVPEISLTGQIIDRFIGAFGENSVAVLHSKLTKGERYDQWQKIKRGEVKIAIGARSAVFAPMDNIGLIVIDEEHEATYKADHSPKYDTVEVAIKRLKDRDNQGVLLLGSATPSVATYSRIDEGIYKLIKLTKRYNSVSLPKCDIVDMRDELRSGNKTIFSKRLISEMNQQLKAGKQVMLFLNRRGYSTFVSCRECGEVIKCPTCGLSMTFHRDGLLKCHYCGKVQEQVSKCPACGSSYVRYFGTGTEKIEEAIQELFPDYEAERIDLDSIKSKGELKKKLKAFERGQTKILIGTQIIAKGLDFKNVGLVGIISADVSLNIPDFRSAERSFQLITQAAGRAGRGDEEGRVIIQTYSPDHYAVVRAAAQDFEGFYREEIRFRKLMMYPPYSDIIRIVFTADSPQKAADGAYKWHEQLKKLLGAEDKNLFPPQEAYMSKIRENYRYSLVIKSPKGSRARYTALIKKVKEEELKAKPKYKAVVDINPYSFV